MNSCHIDYPLLNRQLQALTQDVTFSVTNLANAAALLYRALPAVNWAGFYIYRQGMLLLGPFMGKPACVRIAVDKGVCGKAARTRETVLVENVHAFSGHIACDEASRSEIVVPLIVRGQLFGVMDIDSPLVGRFSDEDKTGLEAFAAILEEAISREEAGSWN